MCGLVGVFGHIGSQEQIAMAYLGTLCSLRGSDSTGYIDYVPDLKGAQRTKYAKTLDDPVVFFSPGQKYWTNLAFKRWDKHNPRLFAVHTRLATVGDIVRDNSHPFYHHPLVGMHNGTIRQGLPEQDKFKTDSECLYWNLAKKGDEFLQDLVSMHQAAFALVWVDLEEGTLNLMRNIERPLHVWRTHDQRTIFWASERSWLESVLPNLQLRGSCEMLPVEEKWSFKLADEKPEVTKERYTRFFRPATVTKTGTAENGGTSRTGSNLPAKRVDETEQIWSVVYNKWMYRGEEQFYIERDKAKRAAERENREAQTVPFDVDESEKVDAKRDAEDNVIPLYKAKHIIRGGSGEYYYHTFNNTYKTESEYKSKLSVGCRGCHRVSNPIDTVEFLDPDNYVCAVCRDDDIIYDLVLAELKEEKEERMEQNFKESQNWSH